MGATKQDVKAAIATPPRHIEAFKRDAVPEPATAGLLLCGMAASYIRSRRRAR